MLAENFRINMKRLRLAKNWSLKEMAKRMGVTLGYVSNLEKIESSPTTETIERVAKAFNENPLVLLQSPVEESVA